MEGIYIHIPFCRQACRYCDFYFTVSQKYLDGFVDALLEEIRQKGEKHKNKTVGSLYLGGGTPSLLSPVQMDKILNALHPYFSFTEDYEWTMECNPEDLDQLTLARLRKSGFNRLSIGVQSFSDKDLELMRRAHGSAQAEAAVHMAASEGFENISIDLIYGIPGQAPGQWEENLERSLSLPISHLSAYHLTFEPGTVFDHWRKQGRLVPAPEEISLEQYGILRKKMKEAEFDHYELSNFSRGGKLSKHNLLYWSGKPYLGVGPSAHSFDGKRRSWNFSSLKKYMESIHTRGTFSESEILTPKDHYHDMLITTLRTRWGIDPLQIKKRFGKNFLMHFNQKAAPFLESGVMHYSGENITIHPDHWLISDHIFRELFMDGD